MANNNKAEVEAFAKAWVAMHVRVVPGLSNIASEVDRLAAHITSDARQSGISGGELNRTLGDIDDFLTEQYRQISATAA